MNHESFKQETIIYGGAFNPPTRAHQAILQACVDYAEPRHADVWLMPSGSRSDKEIAASYERRMMYVETLARDVVARTMPAVETMELTRQNPTETIDTVNEMNERYPDRSFTWVFGSDSIGTMRQWKDGDVLMDTLSMLIVERPGTPLGEMGRYAVKLDVITAEISSTIVKQRLASGQPVGDLVTPAVERLLIASGPAYR